MRARRVIWPLTRIAYSVGSRRSRYRPEDNLYVFSDPRGGSTWLTQILSQYCSRPVLWEPANPKAVSELQDIGVGWRQYIPESAEWPELKEFFTKVLSGRYVNYHLSSKMTLLKYLTANQFLVKFCRANGFLAWFVRTFNPHHPPVYLVRHPLAVIASQLQHGAWEHVQPIVQTNEPYSENYAPFLEIVGPISTLEEKLMIDWCKGNAENLSAEPSTNRWITIHYEHLLVNPRRELNSIWSLWGWKWKPEVLASVRRPSATVRGEDFQPNVNLQLRKWREVIRPELFGRMDEILAAFGVTRYNCQENLPIQ